jgi:hypothetical protein
MTVLLTRGKWVLIKFLHVMIAITLSGLSLANALPSALPLLVFVWLASNDKPGDRILFNGQWATASNLKQLSTRLSANTI